MSTAGWIVLIVAIVLALFASSLVFVRRRMRAAGIYVFPRTKFGWAVVFSVEGDNGKPVRVLNVGGMYQSATYLDDHYCDLVFEYDKLYDHMFDANIDIHNVCMIGGGGYAYPKHLIATQPKARIDVVEIDPKMTSIAQRYFFLDRLIEEYDTDKSGRLGLICDDGRTYLESLANNSEAPRYDAILNDSFSGRVPATSMTTLEAAQAVHASLTPGGVYLSNIVSAVEGDQARFLRAIAKTLGEVFAHVWVIPCDRDGLADRDNNMIIATDGDYSFEGALPVEVRETDNILTDAHNPVKELVG